MREVAFELALEGQAILLHVELCCLVGRTNKGTDLGSAGPSQGSQLAGMCGCQEGECGAEGWGLVRIGRTSLCGP